MSVLEAVIGWLAPPQCLACGMEGRAVCEACEVSEILPHGERCWRCGAMSFRCRACPSCQSFGGPRRVFVTTDYAGLASQLVRAYKFGYQRFAAETLAQLMVETFLAYNSDDATTRVDYLVVPIPTATSRIRQRGFDHSALLARTVAHRLKLDYRPVLGRLGQASQVGTRRAERLKLPLDNYFVRIPMSVQNRNIFLIDDVVTTGATLRAATKALRAAGAKHVDALVFAKKL